MSSEILKALSTSYRRVASVLRLLRFFFLTTTDNSVSPFSRETLSQNNGRRASPVGLRGSLSDDSEVGASALRRSWPAVPSPARDHCSPTLSRRASPRPPAVLLQPSLLASIEESMATV